MPEGGPQDAQKRVDQLDVFDLMTSLSDRSLVVLDQGGTRIRHRLLETVRQYGRDLLHDQGESETVRNLHLDYFLTLVEQLEPKLKGSEQMETLLRLREEDENLRAALEWSFQSDGSEKGLRMVAKLVLYWWRQGNFVEGTDWCLRASKTATGLKRTVLRARALSGAGLLTAFQGDCATAKTFFDESLDILTELQNSDFLSETYCGLGFATFFLDDYIASRKYTTKAYELAKEQNDDWYTAWTGYFLGIVNRVDGDYDAAMKSYHEALAIYRKMGDRIFASYPIYDIGLAEYYRGNMEPARRYLEESLAIRRETKDGWGTAESLYGLGLVGFTEKNYVAARQSLEESLKIGNEVGDKTRVAISLHWLAMVSLAEGDVERARSLNDESTEIYGEVEDRWGLAHCLAGHAALAVRDGQLGKAIKLWSLANKIREEINSPLPPVQKQQRDLDIAAARSALMDDAAFEKLWEEGRGTTLELTLEALSSSQSSF